MSDGLSDEAVATWYVYNVFYVGARGGVYERMSKDVPKKLIILILLSPQQYGRDSNPTCVTGRYSTAELPRQSFTREDMLHGSCEHLLLWAISDCTAVCLCKD